jgi:hypothetical protein
MPNKEHPNRGRNKPFCLTSRPAYYCDYSRGFSLGLLWIACAIQENLIRVSTIMKYQNLYQKIYSSRSKIPTKAKAWGFLFEDVVTSIPPASPEPLTSRARLAHKWMGYKPSWSFLFPFPGCYRGTTAFIPGPQLSRLRRGHGKPTSRID